MVGAVLQAMSEPVFGLHAVATSTGGAAVLIAVNGPVRDQLGIHYKENLFVRVPGPQRSGRRLARRARRPEDRIMTRPSSAMRSNHGSSWNRARAAARSGPGAAGPRERVKQVILTDTSFTALR